jgi:N6-adenosine-specific RNA methylase IME4
MENKIKKYQVILADPPWQYDDPKGNDPKMGGIIYKTMANDEIYLLPVQNIVDNDCLLFLWATMPKLKEAITTIESWGFKYITCAFVWVKQNPNNDFKHPELFYPTEKEVFNIYSGLGHWVNGNVELCLLGKKGTPKRASKSVKQVIIAPRGKHSQKPNEARIRIRELCGESINYIELFAREKHEGWDCIGNEINGKDIKEELEETTRR